ncbi:Predicted transcriptional regulator YdeE, contains AraC-type DNA-binding domain [Halobacillus dabanensis]|uniref:Predicted transcriptional regulator YdeE, contains AraC-type DNA-binding domain n=1 Tax=Halobacillus dabanensis TaxID=240302 RepID=A0A1I3QAN5_HALDA|nr:GyrI-like domain-containing protein [Halobacillus dabanensis]SFJ31334.1 Predicted transcriptional regulator YdeE, contains AraC-type DNA-binding domain [Halobacillus dabanensis]
MEKINPITLKGIREVEEKKLVGFRVVCEDMAGYGQEIPKASMALHRRKNEVKQIVEPVKLIGAFKAAETSEEDDGYWVCYEVHDFEDIPDGMVTLVIPAQNYAVLNFKGHASEIFKVYTHLHKWIEENGHTRVPDKWSLEIYSKWTENEDIVDLCDPVV